MVHKARYTKDIDQHEVAIKTLKGHITYCVNSYFLMYIATYHNPCMCIHIHS